jgi:hypothetical protein
MQVRSAVNIVLDFAEASLKFQSHVVGEPPRQNQS